MEFDKKEVLYLAKLAKLKISDSEVESYNHQLQDVLSYVEKINRLNLDQAQESISGVEGKIVNPRPDTVSSSKPQVIKSAGEKDGSYVVAPHVFSK